MLFPRIGFDILTTSLSALDRTVGAHLFDGALPNHEVNRKA
jgi:hypothetical protein